MAKTKLLEDQHMQTSSVDKVTKSSSREDESDSGSESEEPSNKVAAAPPVLKSVSKRPENEETSSRVKRAKTVSGDVENHIGEASKKPFFQRLWSEEDEIKLLEAMIKFNESEGKSPYGNMNSFYDSVKKDFSFAPSRLQFTEKIRGLKIKFGKRKYKESNDHDMKSMGLAERIWGPAGFAYDSALVKPKAEEEEVEKDLVCARDPKPSNDWVETIVRSIAGHGLDESFLKHKWTSMPTDDKKLYEQMYKVLEIEKYELDTKFLLALLSGTLKSS